MTESVGVARRVVVGVDGSEPSKAALRWARVMAEATNSTLDAVIAWEYPPADGFAGLPADTLILPSHGKPFRGLHIRIGQLVEHHRERLAEVDEACATPQTAADIVPIMCRRQLDAHQLTFAMGEALAHLHKLWYDGVLRRETGAGGVIRFVRR